MVRSRESGVSNHAGPAKRAQSLALTAAMAQ